MRNLKKLAASILFIAVISSISYSCNDSSFDDMKVEKLEEKRSSAQGGSGEDGGTNPPPCSNC